MKVKRDVENKENVGKTDSGTSKGSNPCKQASPAPLKQMDKNIHKGRYHYSREVSISLLLIRYVEKEQIFRNPIFVGTPD